MAKKCDFLKVVNVLQTLHKNYPNYTMGMHLSTVIDECGDIWGLSDSEFLNNLNIYMSKLEMDVPHSYETEIDSIIKEGMDLDNILKEEDYEDF